MKLPWLLALFVPLCSCQQWTPSLWLVDSDEELNEYYRNAPVNLDRAATFFRVYSHDLKENANFLLESLLNYRWSAESGNVEGYMEYFGRVGCTTETVLHLAALANRIDVVKQELARGVDVNIKTMQGLHPEIERKISHGIIKFDKKYEFMRTKSRPFNCPDPGVYQIFTYYETPLHYAARGGHLETYKFLLSKGADESITNSQGETPKQLLEESQKNNS